ncbi:MAG TPA: hypothetical protein VFK69_03655, partial [Candidatus Eisenbacteria bacterium]|nr:hypothetical protein [Candidatus Eisenbacteria bacterium]
MRFAPLALAVILGLVLFTGLSDTGLLDVREARDAAVARELIERREVLTPLYAGDPLWEKPTPAYALEVLARFAGSSPRRSRLQRALLATLLVL